MFLFLEISPIVIIAVAALLLVHVVITGAMIITALAVVGVSAVLTAGIIYAMTARMSARPPELTYARYRAQLAEEPVTMAVEPPLPRREPIEGPHEVHNHIHLEGIDPEAVAAFIRSQHGGDWQ